MDRILPAEWHKQRAVIVVFPHKNSDWKENLKSVYRPFIRIVQAISYWQPVYLICDNREEVSKLFCSNRNILFIEIATNDTWVRDYGYISIFENSKLKLLDFKFDGWGGKFEAKLDNKFNRVLHAKGYPDKKTLLEEIDFVLEGGSIDSDGKGTILTTKNCLCHPNRNGGLSKKDIEKRLKNYFGTQKVLWLDNGHLEGDDTDSHIDTLARFISTDTILYVKCRDKNDTHYDSLSEMERELKTFKTSNNTFYNLIPVPLPTPKFNIEGMRLPATYANFLIINHALLVPTYSVKEDKVALNTFKKLFPKREIIPIECSKLIEQGGSLHCSTMQVI